MRRSVLLTILNSSFLLVATLSSHAQTVPNPGFEEYFTVGSTSCQDPVSWDTPNDGLALFSVCNVFQDDTKFQSGSSSVRLETISVPLLPINAPGTVTTGTLELNIDNPLESFVVGGSPVIGMPTALTGWYDYEPMGGDSLTIRVWMLNVTETDTTVISMDEFIEWNASGGWTQFTVPINYTTSDVPELAQILVRSSRDTESSTVGTTVWIDDLRLDGAVGGLGQSAPELPAIYPNPARDFMVISSQGNSTLEVYSIVGERTMAQQLNHGNNSVSVRELGIGVYLYRQIFEDGSQRTGKFRVSR